MMMQFKAKEVWRYLESKDPYFVSFEWYCTNVASELYTVFYQYLKLKYGIVTHILNLEGGDVCHFVRKAKKDEFANNYMHALMKGELESTNFGYTRIKSSMQLLDAIKQELRELQYDKK